MEGVHRLDSGLEGGTVRLGAKHRATRPQRNAVALTDANHSSSSFSMNPVSMNPSVPSGGLLSIAVLLAIAAAAGLTPEWAFVLTNASAIRSGRVDRHRVIRSWTWFARHTVDS